MFSRWKLSYWLNWKMFMLHFWSMDRSSIPFFISWTQVHWGHLLPTVIGQRSLCCNCFQLSWHTCFYTIVSCNCHIPKDAKCLRHTLTHHLQEQPWAAVVPRPIINRWSNPQILARNTDCQAERWWVPFFSSSVWPNWRSNPQPIRHKGDTTTVETTAITTLILSMDQF